MSEKLVEEAKATRTLSPRTNSKSMEETKERRSRWSDERTGWRLERESRSWAEKRDNKDSSNEGGRCRLDANIQQRIRNFEMQRRSHETESRFRQQKRGRDSDSSMSPYCKGSDSKRAFNKMRREPLYSSVYPYRPGEPDCLYYLRTGECRFGRSCRFNHPALRPPTECQYFLKGACRYGSTCRNHHVKGTDDGHTHQEHEQRDSESQRREAQENVREERQRESIGPERSEAQENVHEEILMEIPSIQNVEAHGQQNLEDERKRDIERQRREARMRLEQMKPTVEFNEIIQIGDALAEFGIERKEGDGF